MRVHLDGRERRSASYESRGHAAAAVRERHQQPALHQAAAVVMLGLCHNRVFMLAIDEAMPQRPDQAEEAGGIDDGPAGGFEFLRGRIGRFGGFQFRRHVQGFRPWVSSVAEAEVKPDEAVADIECFNDDAAKQNENSRGALFKCASGQYRVARPWPLPLLWARPAHLATRRRKPFRTGPSPW